MKAKTRTMQDDMRPECAFDYSTPVRGTCFRRLLKAGANAVVLDSDLARAFRSSAPVNKALRSLLKLPVAPESNGRPIAATLRQKQDEAEKLDAAIAANLKELGYGS
jgi:hypothetical protein